MFLSPSCFKARITKSDPVGSVVITGATAWRIFRAKRWRCTEPPTVLLIISPHFARSLFVTGDMYKYPTKCCEVTRRPLLVARAKSELAVKRAL
ncbi:MAG: hypothetical protein RL466_658 [Actinomycetota bacterium]